MTSAECCESCQTKIPSLEKEIASLSEKLLAAESSLTDLKTKQRLWKEKAVLSTQRDRECIQDLQKKLENANLEKERCSASQVPASELVELQEKHENEKSILEKKSSDLEAQVKKLSSELTIEKEGLMHQKVERRALEEEIQILKEQVKAAEGRLSVAQKRKEEEMVKQQALTLQLEEEKKKTEAMKAKLDQVQEKMEVWKDKVHGKIQAETQRGAKATEWLEAFCNTLGTVMHQLENAELVRQGMIQKLQIASVSSDVLPMKEEPLVFIEGVLATPVDLTQAIQSFSNPANPRLDSCLEAMEIRAKTLCAEFNTSLLRMINYQAQRETMMQSAVEELSTTKQAIQNLEKKLQLTEEARQQLETAMQHQREEEKALVQRLQLEVSGKIADVEKRRQEESSRLAEVWEKKLEEVELSHKAQLHQLELRCSLLKKELTQHRKVESASPVSPSSVSHAERVSGIEGSASSLGGDKSDFLQYRTHSVDETLSLPSSKNGMVANQMVDTVNDPQVHESTYKAYMKNVVYQFLCSREDLRAKMIPAIVTVLNFTTEEKNNIALANPSCPPLR